MLSTQPLRDLLNKSIDWSLKLTLLIMTKLHQFGAGVKMTCWGTSNKWWQVATWFHYKS